MKSICSFLLQHVQQALLMFALAFCGSLFFAQPTFAALTLTSGSNATTTPSVATAITGFQVVGPATSSTPVQLRVTNGTLSMTTTSSLVFVGATTGSTINFSGTVEDINNALATLRYTRNTTGSDTLEVSLVNAGEVFFSENGHLYKFISGSYNWSQARTAAEGLTAYGASGYLATITSSTENSFVYARISGDGWLGASDISTEDTWIWATGPEAETSFYQGRGNAGGGAVSGRYNNWDTNEPNDFGGAEDCGYIYASRSGTWNDFPCSASQGYVVEFGNAVTLPTVVATNISIVTADVPAVSTLSPANSATLVSPSSNLTIAFTKIVNAGTGSILIKKTSDNSTIESIDVTSDRVSGGGTTSITINPSATLADTTSYYVIVPATAFVDNDENSFEGIASSSTWAFTTADATSPDITT
ncbi:Ig-like domain-containing protein, partial [Patescibacteria group bacterium]|nr:Ig-like domain-containing protein [Patescibacteria group bacterium]